MARAHQLKTALIFALVLCMGCGGYTHRKPVTVSGGRMMGNNWDQTADRIEQMRIKNVTIALGVGEPIYAYIGKKGELIHISDMRMHPGKDEEVVRVYNGSFMPDFEENSVDILEGKRGLRENEMLLANVIDAITGSSQPESAYHQSRFTGATPGTIASDGFKLALFTCMVGGVNLALGGGYFKTEKFKPLKFKGAVVAAGLDRYVRTNFIDAADYTHVNNRLLCRRFMDHIEGAHGQTGQGTVVLDTASWDRLSKKGLLGFEFTEEAPEAKIRELVSCCLDVYLEPRHPLDVKAAVPPAVPTAVMPAVKRLTKDEFETLAAFKERVQQEAAELEKTREMLYLRYEKEVAARNRRINELNAVHDYDLKLITREQAAKQEQVERIAAECIRLALATVGGRPGLQRAQYDAETGTMTVTANLIGESDRLTLKMPVNRARYLKSNLADAELKVIYRVRGNAFRLEQAAIKTGSFWAALHAAGYQETAPAVLSVDLTPMPSLPATVQGSRLHLQQPAPYEAVKFEDFVVADSLLRDHLKAKRQPPHWFLGETFPVHTGCLIGYGEGKTKLEAKSHARVEIALALGKGSVAAGTRYRKVLRQWNGLNQAGIDLETTLNEEMGAVMLKDLTLVKSEYVLGRYYVALAYAKEK